MKTIEKETIRRRGTGKLAVNLMVLLLMAGVMAGCSESNGTGRSSMAADGDSSFHTSSSSNAVSTDSSKSLQDKAEKPADAKAASSTQNGASLGETDDVNAGAFDRKIVYKGNVTMEVEAYDSAQTALRDLIHLGGGYLLNFSDQKTASELGGSFTIKVPAAGFDRFLVGLEKIKHNSFQSSAQGTDVTEEYVDIQSRLKARQVVEARLLAFMEQASKTDDLLKISKQLGDVQTEIEGIKGRIRYLDNNVAYSTIDLRMYQVIEGGQTALKEKHGIAVRISDAAVGSAKVIYAFVQDLLVFIAAAIPVLVLLAVIGIPFYIKYRGGKRKLAAMREAQLMGSSEGSGTIVTGAIGSAETVETAKTVETDDNKK